MIFTADASQGQLVAYTFTDTLAASKSALAIGGSYEMPFDGNVVAIGYGADTVKTGGELSVSLNINGTSHTTMIIGSVQTDILLFGRSEIPLGAGDVIEIDYTSNSSYTPDNSSVSTVTVWVLHKMEGI